MESHAQNNADNDSFDQQVESVLARIKPPTFPNKAFEVKVRANENFRQLVNQMKPVTGREVGAWLFRRENIFVRGRSAYCQT